MFRSKKVAVSVTIPHSVLEAIYDECDRYDADETGGRLIGTYKKRNNHYDVDVSGMLGPGPNATRTATSFFQDGVYQERMFRSIESQHPEIEHLGNWHTHHVNGFPTLSGGDLSTYFNIVNHQNHNTDFFYALLVVKKNRRGDPRYAIKHFFFHRSDENVYEVPHSEVQVVDAPALAIVDSSPTILESETECGKPNLERVKDQELFAEFYPGLKAMIAKATGGAYWKGSIDLVDGTHATVVAAERADRPNLAYEVTAAGQTAALDSVKAIFKGRAFPSARSAVIEFERQLNREIFRSTTRG